LSKGSRSWFDKLTTSGEELLIFKRLLTSRFEKSKKNPGEYPGFFGFDSRLTLNSCYVRGLKPFRTLCHVKSYSITFCKGFETFACDCGEMAEYIFATFLLKKSKTLAVIKPFYCSVYHVLTSPDSSLILPGYIRIFANLSAADMQSQANKSIF
jgi:hypothetical protein